MTKEHINTRLTLRLQAHIGALTQQTMFQAEEINDLQQKINELEEKLRDSKPNKK